MPSPQAIAVHQALAQFREQLTSPDHQTLAEQRDAMTAMAEMAADPGGVTVRETYAGGVRAFWHEPEGAATDRVVLYLHGGGYIFGSPTIYARLVGHLARAVGCRALAIDYRLAPEHPHPAAVNDSVAVYHWLRDQGYAPEHVALAGDSAGGGLTLATLLALRDADLPLPGAAVALSPWTDLELSGESIVSRAERDLLVARETLKIAADLFLAGTDPRHPHASPLYAPLRGLPPIYIQVGEDEILFDDSARFAQGAARAGVEVRLDVFPEMQHVFQFSAGKMPEADDAIARIGAWLRPRLGLPSA